MDEITKNGLSRRNFLKFAGLTGVGAGLAACRIENPTALVPAAQATTAATTEHDMEAAPPPTTAADAAAEMDAMHEAGIKTFVDGIGSNPGFWGTPLEFTMDGDTKVFELTCAETQWAVEPDFVINAMTYNGILPGPVIRVTEGDKVRVLVHNEMTQSTSVHWHGVIVPNNMDGVPYITQPPIKPGETFTYEFQTKNAGSHMYHSHHNAAEQVTRGLLGAFLIDPKDKSQEPEYDSDYVLILNDASTGFSINGKGFPHTQPIVAKLGEKIRIRYMNEGLVIHPMHLHGLEQLVFAKDGWNLPQPYYADTVNIAPGERYDVIVDCHTPGIWAFHCHILSHAESAHGMFGMVTAVVVNE
ncbi:MAG: multicopper oxidase domain-containing protein [Anaerolineales bacterium]|uniref:multicopper oxidase domain-containing protein n=1 Tax=Promineifilum sp. TaxID=2664178 RepID=UPI001D934F9B|nr:multicopper oxidase domain-containing protein [Anaerolineales bacterium]MCB8934757.1 multicopper oxidase domain-containing protein [Promineifilum sp.]MCO5181529.1 multicopper oxidase domain-containing protein [Promineifilum sp.]